MHKDISVIISWVWRRKVALLAGVLAIYLAICLTPLSDSTYQVRISLVYPGAENGLYPDGQRLLREDLIADERIEEALEAMREKGWYTDITARQIKNNLSVREYLSNPVQDKVESLLEEGREYTYYNNEFILSFTQPTVLRIKDASSLFGLLRPDRSKEFVEELIRSVNNSFLKEHTEGNVFAEFADYLVVGDADYGDLVSAYTDKATLCMNYLNKKKAADSTFVSTQTGMSFEDLVTGYQSLLDVQIAHLLEYSTSEKVTSSLQEMINRLEVEIEDKELIENKKQDEYEIAHTAMIEYDHTFSENIIIVSVNEENGLYQARPKTAYDTVTQQALDAGVAASTAGNIADNNKLLIDEYSASMGNGQDVMAKLKIADGMVEEIIAEYDRLTELSTATITEYLNKLNSSYIQTSAIEQSGMGLTDLIKLGFGAMLCVLIVVCVVLDKRAARAKTA